MGSTQCAELDAQVLLADLLQVERAFLFAHGDCELNGAQTTAFQSMIERRAGGEPVAYIVGTKGFYDLELVVTPAVLVPRPETELLLEEALRLTDRRSAFIAADIGTGSGALAIVLSRHSPRATIYATEVSADALTIARQNAASHEAAVTFFRGNLAQPLIDHGIRLDLLVANLPYIATDALESLPVSQWEPRLALDGGVDGLDLLRELLTQLRAVCKPGAQVLLEIGADQGDAAVELVSEQLGVDATVLPDYAGLDRIVCFRVDSSQC